MQDALNEFLNRDQKQVFTILFLLETYNKTSCGYWTGQNNFTSFPRKFIGVRLAALNVSLSL